MSLRKYIFLLGVRLRNPSLWKHYNFLKTSEAWTSEQLKEYQLTNLISFLEHSGNNSPYYKNLFKSIGWNPGDKFTFELFQKIPVLNKNTLIEQNESIHAKGLNENLQVCETSGTSGQVLTFRRNESWDSFNRASIFRGYSWYDVKPWDFNIYFWGFDKIPVKKIKLRISDFLVNRYRMFSYSKEALQKLAKIIPKAAYIEGYSSMIYELACAAETLHLDHSKLKLVKGTSEKIYPHYSEKTKAVFGKSIVSEYGAAETGIIAFECPHGNMHINSEGVFVETDEENEIIVTNFHSLSFPVIRYKLGDSVQLKAENYICPCGMKHPIIEEVTGRIGKLIIGKEQNYPSLTFYYIFKNLYFTHQLNLNYQAHQSVKGSVEIQLKESVDTETEKLIIKECEKYFGVDIIITISNNRDFVLRNGKLRDFISTIN